jgi:hypothetical protein
MAAAAGQRGLGRGSQAQTQQLWPGLPAPPSCLRLTLAQLWGACSALSRAWVLNARLQPVGWRRPFKLWAGGASVAPASPQAGAF